jgi:hypothetical protein
LIFQLLLPLLAHPQQEQQLLPPLTMTATTTLTTMMALMTTPLMMTALMLVAPTRSRLLPQKESRLGAQESHCRQTRVGGGVVVVGVGHMRGPSVWRTSSHLSPPSKTRQARKSPHQKKTPGKAITTTTTITKRFHNN